MGDLMMMDESLEHFEKKEAITATELERLQVDEEITGAQRVSFLLKEGLPVQKASVFSTLSWTLAQESEEENIEIICKALVKFISDLDDESTELEHAFTALRDLICTTQGGAVIFQDPNHGIEDMWHSISDAVRNTDKEIEPDYIVSSDIVTNILLPPVLKCLRETEKEPICKITGECIVFAINRIDVPITKTSIIEVALNRGEMTQPTFSRIVCSAILGAVVISSSLKPEEVQELFYSRMLELCQDVDGQVRACTARQLEPLCRILDPELVSKDLIEELVELLRDEEDQVKEPAFMTLISMLDFVREPDLAVLLPPFLDIVTNPNEHMVLKVAESFGVIFYKISLRQEFKAEEMSPFIDAYVKMVTEAEAEARQLCAFNFPAIIHACGANQYGTKLEKVYQQMVDDEDEQVRATIAAGLHEVARILGVQRVIRYLRQIFISLLTDESELVRTATVEHCDAIMSHFSEISDSGQKTLALESILTACVKYEASLSCGKWRKRVKFLESAFHFVNYINDSLLNQHITPILFRCMTEGCRKEQYAAVDALLWCTRHSTHPSHRHMNISKLKSEFGSGSSSGHRNVFLEACRFALKYYSCQYFCDIFLDKALDLIDDPVPNVRMRAFQLLPSLYHALAVNGNQELRDKLNKIGVDTRDDEDKDVFDAILLCRREKEEIESNQDDLTRDKAEDVAKLNEESRKLLSQDVENLSLDGPRGGKDIQSRFRALDLSSHASSLGSKGTGQKGKISKVQHLPTCNGPSKTRKTGMKTQSTKQPAVKIPGISHPRPPPGSSKRPASPLSIGKSSSRGRSKG